MVKVRIVSWREATWYPKKRILAIPLPFSRIRFLLGLHEVMHWIRGHDEESISTEIEAWQGVKRILSFLHLWRAADERFVDYCINYPQARQRSRDQVQDLADCADLSPKGLIYIDPEKVEWIQHLGNRIVGYNAGKRFELR